MASEDNVYRELQEYLDRETVAFPATETGSDIKLLKLLFTPEQARATMCLTRKPEPVESIYERANPEEFTIEELGDALYEAAGRGLVFFQKVDGIRHYKIMPFVVGFYETQIFNLTPEFTNAAVAYSMDGGGQAFFDTKIPIMRTIPVSESIEPDHHVSSYDHIRSLVDQSDGPVVVFECICRKHSEQAGNPCQKATQRESCMAFGPFAETMAEFNKGKKISKSEALDILRTNEADGLVFQPSNTQHAEFICSCCGCCCGQLISQKSHAHPLEIWESSYFVEVDADLCTGCEDCVEACQVNAMTFDEDAGVSAVDLNRCIGCGNCVPVCPVEAIALQKKVSENVPPKDYDEQQEILTTGK